MFGNSAPSPQGSSSNQGGQGQGQGQGQGAGHGGGQRALPGGHGGATTSVEGGADDIADLRRALSEADGRFQRTNDELKTVRGKADQVSTVLERIRQAVAGDDGKPKAPSRKDRAAQNLDYYLRQHLDAEKQGGGFPLTTHLATEFFEYQMEAEERLGQMAQLIDKLNKQVEKLSSPATRLADQAFANIDSAVIDSLEKIYGAGEDMLSVKRAQYESVGSVLDQQVRELRQKDPQLWEEILRSPRKQAAFARRIVESHLPPKARQIMEEDAIRQTPMGVSELWEAFRESAQIQDPTERAKVREQIRREILATSAENRRGGPLRGLYQG